jgi:hypothetical protein
MSRVESERMIGVTRGGTMIGTVATFVFVLAVLAVVAYALFEISPFAHHADRYHEPGERQQSPRLD